jgi:uncharacterized protein with HEPN domain
MNEVDRWRLDHILAAAREALLFAKEETKSSLEQDRKLQLALAMEITTIGEAASRLSEELRAKYPELQWHLIIGMRNILVHAYFRLDLDVLWEAVRTDLPNLISQLERLITLESGPD